MDRSTPKWRFDNVSHSEKDYVLVSMSIINMLYCIYPLTSYKENVTGKSE